MLEVDSESLRALSSSLMDIAETISSLDPSQSIAVGVAAMPRSAVGEVAAGSARPILDAYRATADRLRHMANAALTSAHSYDDAEHAFREQLRSGIRSVP